MAAENDLRELLVSAYRQEKRTATFGFVASPLEDELKDLERQAMTFVTLPFIPFFDNSDSTLRVLRLLGTLSPTHGSCIQNMQNYITGGGLRAVQKVRPGASFARAEFLDKAQEEAVYDFIETWHPDIDVFYLMEQVNGVYLNLATFGNGFVKVTISKIGGKVSMYFESVDAEKVRYLITIDGSRKVGISALWDYEYTSRYFPEVFPVYPEMGANEDGSITTVIHIKNKAVGRDWYGLPKSYSSIFYQFIEYQLGDYSTKGYANMWTGKTFMETAGDDVEVNSAEMEEFRAALRDTFSAGGKGKTIVHRHRSQADPATMIHEFEDTKSHEFHESIAAIAEKQIIKAHDWSHILMSIPQPGRLGGSGEFLEIYEAKYGAVIIPWQDKVMLPFNILYRLFQEYSGNAGPEASLALQNLIVQSEEEMEAETDVLVDEKTDVPINEGINE